MNAVMLPRRPPPPTQIQAVLLSFSRKQIPPRVLRRLEQIYWNAFLFPEMELEAQTLLEKLKRRGTWFFLIHRDMLVSQMRCELSNPITMSEDRHIDGWSERILLKLTDFDSSAHRHS
jgi:hypothetical protein